MTLIAFSLALAAMGIYVATADEAPGAAGLGMLFMVAGVVLGVRAARHRLPVWAARTALAAGVAVAAAAAFLIHGAVVTAPLFAQSPEVPSTAGPAQSQDYATAIERARGLVRAAMVEQNLPGMSVALGAGGRLVWAEGFGWRDVVTRSPVTPDTRFNIGTASSAIRTAVAPLALLNTGTEPVAQWSPSHLGEPEDDFPPFTLIRHVIFRPLGLAPDQPLPGNRASFYVPLSDNDPVRGRREMYMRDMECCPNRMAFYSTPSDLVHFAMATKPGSVNGALAGGMVMSLVTGGDGHIAVAVTSNMAYANTSPLARRVADAFAEQRP